MMLRLESLTGCPRAQRIRIHLERKGLDYEDRCLDRAWPRAAHRALLPLGHGPILRHNDVVLIQTAVIAEYLEDAFPETPLFPADARPRAGARAMIALCDGPFAEALAAALDDDGGVDDLAWSQTVQKAWRAVNLAIGHGVPSGVLSGAAMSAADAAFGPYFQRFALLGLDRALLRTRPRTLAHVLRWRDRLMAEPLLSSTGPELVDGERHEFVRVPRLAPHPAQARPALLPPASDNP